MFKSILKEILIMLLLLIVIVLVLAIILYDYSPSQKTIPKQVAEYQLSADVLNELGDSAVKEPQNIVKTYKIEEEDLYSYEETEEYDRGKINPFKLSSGDVVNAILGIK